jgi:predicted MFS family arabinose efflux permease
VAGLLGGRIGGLLYDKYKNYQMAFFTAAGLALIALICELLAKRPAIPAASLAGRKAPSAA